MVISNWKRLTLAVAGIAFCVLIFQTGMVFIHSYNRSVYQDYLDFATDCLLLRGRISPNLLKNISINIPDSRIVTYTNNVTLWLGSSRNEKVVYYANLIGASPYFTRLPLPDADSMNKLHRTEILAGRDLNSADQVMSNHVVVISELTSKILFGTADSLGKTIRMNLNSHYQDELELQVVGIYRNTPDDLLRIGQLNESAANGNTFSLIQNFYVPDSLMDERLTSDRHMLTAVVHLPENTRQNHRMVNLIAKPYQSEVQLYSYSIHMARLNQINSSMQKILSLLIMALTIISGFSLMNSLLFSMKERIGEIGIKKSLGASSDLIVAQFFIEMLILCLIGATIGTLLSRLIILILQPLINNLLLSRIVLEHSLNVLAASFFLAIFQGILFSVFPVIYAVNIKIVDAINQD